MDISAFFISENAPEEDNAIDEYKRALFKLANKGYVTTNQYSYLMDYANVKGTISNINKLIELVAELKSDSDKNSDVLVEFKKALNDSFKHIIKYDQDADTLRINKNVQYYATKLDTITFTEEQKKAVKKMYNFVIDHNQNTMGIYGYAGTGKTTTVVEFVSYMIYNKYLHSVAFVAPTNKALIVIKNKFKHHIKLIIKKRFNRDVPDNFNFDDEVDYLEQNGVMINFLTINKLLMYQTDYSLDGELIFIRGEKTGSLISQFELVIIDECSMISMDMIDIIFEEIRTIIKSNTMKSKGHVPVPKVVFSGDPAQLPPVNEENSSIFCQKKGDLLFKDYLEVMISKVCTVVSNSESILRHKYKLLVNDLCSMKFMLLQNVVRSRLNTVTAVCHELRNWITQDELPDLSQYMGKEGVGFFEHDERIDKVKSKWFEKFLESVKKGKPSIIITWTNKQTDIYNDIVRSQIFKGKKLQKFEPNDVLMLGEFYGLDLGEDFVKQRLYTSEQIKVLTAKMTEVPINCFESVTSSSLRKMKQALNLEAKIKVLIDGLNEFYCRNVKFMCWVLKVQKFDEDSDQGQSMTLIVVDDADLEKYRKHKTDTALAIKNFSKQLLNQYRNAPKQVEKLVIKPIWKQWNKVFVEPFANVNYGYSITGHKGQGSSYLNVFIDLDDILLNRRAVEAKKCAYTSATRTVNELNLLI